MSQALPGQAALLSPDILSPTKPIGTRDYSKGKQVPFTAGAPAITLLSYSGGPGYVDDMWMGIDTANQTGREAGTLTLTVDGVVVYQNRYDLFFGQLFYTQSYGSGEFDNQFMACRAGQSWMIPIPFSSSISITLANSDPSATSGLLWWEIGYVKSVPNLWPRTRKLHTSVQLYDYRSIDQVSTLVDASGLANGRLLGVFMYVDSIHTGSGSPATPATAPLEGKVSITLDGTLAFESSGTEDYAKMGGFFGFASVGTNVGQYISLVAKDSNHWGFMRFHYFDQYAFANALKVTWTAGNSSISTFTGTVALTSVVWYYTE